MQVRFPFFYLRIALVLVDCNLKSVYPEPLAVRIGQPFQIFHCGFGLDDHDRLTYRGGFGLHFLTCRFKVSRLDVFKPIRLRVFLPILVEVGEFWANVVEFLFPLVMLFASTLDGLHVD